MRHHHFVSDIRHASPEQKPLATLGWTQFVIVAVVIVAVLLLTGVAVWPW